MICRSVIKRYTETIELLVILVNLVRRGLKQNVFINFRFVLQYFSNVITMKKNYDSSGANDHYDGQFAECPHNRLKIRMDLTKEH